MKTSDKKSSSTTHSRKDRMALFLEHGGNKRLRSFFTRLYRLTGGRVHPAKPAPPSSGTKFSMKEVSRAGKK
jgi:hypothetical protein